MFLVFALSTMRFIPGWVCLHLKRFNFTLHCLKPLTTCVWLSICSDSTHRSSCTFTAHTSSWGSFSLIKSKDSQQPTVSTLQCSLGKRGSDLNSERSLRRECKLYSKEIEGEEETLGGQEETKRNKGKREFKKWEIEWEREKPFERRLYGVKKGWGYFMPLGNANVFGGKMSYWSIGDGGVKGLW